MFFCVLKYYDAYEVKSSTGSFSMNKITRSFIVFFSFFSFYINAWPFNGVTIFSPRSQSENLARQLVGWHPFIHQYNKENNYGTFAINPSYSRSVRGPRIAQALFGTDVLTISGSQVMNRSCDDLLADYFGLAPDFHSRVRFDPNIKSFILGLQAFIGFNSWIKGLYLQINAPFVHTRWNLKPCEDVFNAGMLPFPARYMDQEEIQAPHDSFVSALQCPVPFGQVKQPLCFGLFNCAQSKSGMSDVQIALGYDFILKDSGHCGMNIRCAAPTGSRPGATFLLEPIVGNGKHWELGVGFSGQVLIWEKDGNKEISFFSDATLTHIFKSRQCRSFDLCCQGFGSRYMLLKQFDSLGNYTGTLVPAINVTTREVDVHNSLQFDIAVMFGFTFGNFIFDIGYEGWIRSNERISLCCNDSLSCFGAKGIQNVSTSVGTLSNATQTCQATIFGDDFEDQLCVIDENFPKLLSDQDLNISSAQSPRLITHKLFIHTGAKWDEVCGYNWSPFVGIGGEIEFEGLNDDDFCPDDPYRTTLSQWSVWIKFGTEIG